MNENEEKNVKVQNEEKEIVKVEEKENKNKINKHTNNIGLRIRWLIFGIIIGFFVCIGLYYGIKNEIKNNIEKPKINIDYLTGTIKEMSDLISAELDFSGVIEYETEGIGPGFIKNITKDKFLLRYDGEIKAGIDLKKVEISQQDEKIIVKMPHAGIKFNKVLPGSVKKYDIKKFVFSDGGEEVIDAYDKADKDMKNNANMQKLLNTAEEQAKCIIEGMIKSIDKEAVVEFEFFEEEMVISEEN